MAVLAGLANIDEIVQLTNIGTLFAFVLVCIGVTVLRVQGSRTATRPFRVPGGALLVPMLGAACCIFLMVYLPPASWWRFVGWLVLGAAIYAAYGYSSSVLGRRAGRPATAPGVHDLDGLRLRSSPASASSSFRTTPASASWSPRRATPRTSTTRGHSSGSRSSWSVCWRSPSAPSQGRKRLA